MLSKYLLVMELRCESILYSKLVTKILMRVISNDHAGRKFPTPVLRERRWLDVRMCRTP